MEKEIKKLKELADEYADFVGRDYGNIALYLENSDKFEDKIRIYISKDKDYSITFEGVKITEWSDVITIPLKYTRTNLKKIYDRAKKYLEENKDNIVKLKDKAIDDEIDYLKRHLEDLENQKKEKYGNK